MGQFPDKDDHSDTKKSISTRDKKNYKKGGLSNRIVKKWKEGIIICVKSKFFEDDDTEML